MTRAAWLEKLGVPAAFRNAVINAPNDRTTAAGGIVVAIAMLAVVIGVVVAAFMGLDAFVRARAVALAAQIGASLVHVDVGAGPLLLLFGLIMLMGWASSVRAGRHRLNGFLSAAAGMFNTPPPQVAIRWVMQRLLTGSVRRAAGAATVDDFLRGVAAHQARGWGITAVLLLTPAVVLTALDTDHFWVAGPAGIVEHRMFPPFSSHTHDPSTATTLTTGCNHTDDDERLIYDIGFATGDDFDLGSTEAVSGSKLAAIEAIDAPLGTGVARERWSHLERDPLHPTCLRYWATQYDSDGRRRLTRLMRLTGP
jgi:hypothetical protein